MPGMRNKGGCDIFKPAGFGHGDFDQDLRVVLTDLFVGRRLSRLVIQHDQCAVRPQVDAIGLAVYAHIRSRHGKRTAPLQRKGLCPVGSMRRIFRDKPDGDLFKPCQPGYSRGDPWHALFQHGAGGIHEARRCIRV